MGALGRRQATDKEQSLALRMLALVAEDDQSPEGLALAAERLLSQLHRRLEPLVGPAGYDALIRRALYLARAESPFLQSIRVAVSSGDVVLDGLQASIRDNDPAVVRHGLVAVLANFIWLLVTFIGEDLALRLIREASPGSTRSDPEENGV